MNRTRRLVRTFIAGLCITLACGVPAATSNLKAEEQQLSSQADGQTSLDADSLFDMIMQGNTYADYVASHAGAAAPEREIVINAADYTKTQGEGFQTRDRFEGMDGTALLTEEQGQVEWKVNVPQSGLYHISMLYYPVDGKSSGIVRTLLIDGEVPFEEAAYLQFDRVWDNERSEVQRDNRGNELRPRQQENPEWRETLFKDSEGYYEEPFQFYLSAGEHTLTLVSQREPMAIRQLKLFQQPVAMPYEEVKAAHTDAGRQPTSGVRVVVQGEDAVAKSSPTLYPQIERSSPAVHPYSPSETRVNTIGGHDWRLPGEWIEWEFEVPESGLYNLGFKVQQNFVRGTYSTRRLTIDGEVPFQEMERVPFRYASGYRTDVLGEDEPYLYYLEEGKHVLRLEVTLGEFAELIRQVEESVYHLNAIYRKILMITGAAPDQFRDYRVEQQVPHLLETFAAESDRLKQVSAELRRLSGGSGDSEALLKTMYNQLDEMVDEPHTIPRRLGAYKANTGGLGTWLLTAREMPLQIDEFYVVSPDEKLKKKGAGFWKGLRHELSTFAYSFFIDYNQIGNVASGEEERSITVWIGSGRDQANTLKSMIDDTFTPETGISVNLKLVQMHTLLPATLAGQGPDVAMQIGNDIPVNYAMRNAVADLAGFSDFEEVAERFRPSAIVPYQYESGVYALPETQTFNMLFYRKDIFNELGMSVPHTWEDITRLFAILNKNQMSFGMPLVLQPQYPGENIPPNSLYASLLIQNGGQFYRDGGRESDLDSRVGIEAFKTWTELYTDYKLEREFDFANRFRTGEMPVGIADYTTYNQLTVFAPEIRGLWGFVPIPGTLQEDGSIDRSVPSGGSATVMLESAQDKDASWEFMKWWTSDEVQIAYGREMESLMGAAARYPTANIRALDSLPWPVNDYEQLKAQFEWVEGIPEVPGGYFTGRHLLNAFYSVVVNSEDQYVVGLRVPGKKAEPRETIVEYVEFMHEEIRSKRREFGLPQ